MSAKEKIFEKLILISAVVSVAAVALITVFIFSSGMPAIKETGVAGFITGTDWSPTNGQFGILPLIAGTLAVTALALLIGIPAGVGCAVFLAEITGEKTARIFRSAIELLAGIPSVVYGFFGLVILVPVIRNVFGGSGFSIIAGGIILAVMILPTIVSISANSISSVPSEFREASLSLGADRRETIMKVVLPAAKSGIFSSIILGMGRGVCKVEMKK